MKNNNYKLKAVLIFLILITVIHTQAETVPSGTPFFLTSLGDVVVGSKNILASASNVITGNYVFCWLSNASQHVYCSLRELDGTEIKTINIEPVIDLNVEQLNVELNDNSDFYVMWSTTSDIAKVFGFDSNGNQLFPEIEVETAGLINVPWIHVSMALTPTGFWVVGSRFSSDIIFEDFTNQNIAYRYDASGVLQQTIIDDINPYDTEYNCGATVSSNRSGDLIISWVEINDPLTATDCRGSIVARIFRDSGSSYGDFIDVSSTRDDDEAFFGNPVSRADESGEFIIAWDYDFFDFCDACIVSFVTRVFPVGNGSVIPMEALFFGSEPKIASGSSGNDFAVFADWNASAADCYTNTRLAVNGELDPVIDFITDDCAYSMKDMSMLIDDSMLQIYEDGGAIYGKKYSKPAEIEIADISLLEGSSSDGASQIAVISVALSKPHPSDDEITVNFFTQDITAINGLDYTISEGTLTFPAGTTLQDIRIPIVPDDDYEYAETFSINLELSTNAVISKAQGIVTILNDDDSPLVNNDCVFVGELCQQVDEPLVGEVTLVQITLSIDQAQDRDIVFSYETEDVTATAGLDYVASSGIIEIPAGVTETNIILQVLGDLQSEATETFNVNFSSTNDIVLEHDTLEIGIIDELDCLAVLSPDGHDFEVEGGQKSFTLDVEDDSCGWNITVNDSWITLLTASSGTGDSTITYEVTSQVGQKAFSRAGSIDVVTTLPIVQTSTHTVVQDGDPDLCPFTVDTSQFNFDVNAATGSFNVSVIDECVWDVFSDVPWVTITSPTGPIFGDGLVEFSVSDNAGDINEETILRSTMLDASFDVSIDQTGCTYTLSTDVVDIDDMFNDSVTTDVLAPDNNSSPCTWSAVSSDSWILVVEGNGGQGFGTVNMDVLENPSVEPRSGTVNIAGQIFTVNQEGQPCVYSYDNNTVEVCPNGKTEQLSLLATAGCGWDFTPDQLWLQLINNGNGVGDEISEVFIESNLTEIDRMVTLSLTNNGPEPDGTTQIDKIYNQGGYHVYEDFVSGVVPADFVVSPDGLWQVTNQQLNGTLLSEGFGFALEGTDTAYCSDCKVEGEITLTTLSSEPQPNIGLVGWFKSDQSYVSLAMDEFANLWRLSLFKNGIELFIEVDGGELIPNVPYQLSISYDDQFIYGSVNGVEILSLEHQLVVAPVGYPGFMLNNASGLMDNLSVTGSSADADLIFSQSFEVEIFQVPSACSQ